MKKAIFETAALADAVARANRIAPSKGAAFDRAAGIVVEVDPNSLQPVIIKSTDLDVTYRQVVNVLELGNEPVTWRVPSSLFNGVVSSFPIGPQSTVRLAENGDGNVYFLCGKTKARLRLIAGEYPVWSPFDPDSLAVVPGLARRLIQVAWAVDQRGTGPLSGVHIDGEYLYGCDRANLAMVPCKVPVSEPVTAPLTDIAALLKNTSEIAMGVDRDRLNLMPDSWTQTTCITHAEPYPKVRDLLKDNQTGQIMLKNEDLSSALDKMLVLVKSERRPVTTIKIGDGSMYLEMEVPDVGKIADEIEGIGGENSGDPFIFHFQPDSLKSALMGSGREKVTIKYGPQGLSPIYLVDDNDYLALMMPMNKTS